MVQHSILAASVLLLLFANNAFPQPPAEPIFQLPDDAAINTQQDNRSYFDPNGMKRTTLDSEAKTIDAWIYMASTARSEDNAKQARKALLGIADEQLIHSDTLNKSEQEDLRAFALQLASAKKADEDTGIGLKLLAAVANETCRPLILELATRSPTNNKDSELRQVALCSLLRVADDSCVVPLGRVVTTDVFPPNRVQAVAVLGDIGSDKARKELDRLAKLKSNATLVEDIAKALNAINDRQTKPVQH
jgi:hypothetical protein